MEQLSRQSAWAKTLKRILGTETSLLDLDYIEKKKIKKKEDI